MHGIGRRMSANRYESWTTGEVYEKADWEGGICGLIDYGGSDIFTPLGPEAVEAAKNIEAGMKVIQTIFDEYENG